MAVELRHDIDYLTFLSPATWHIVRSLSMPTPGSFPLSSSVRWFQCWMFSVTKYPISPLPDFCISEMSHRFRLGCFPQPSTLALIAPNSSFLKCVSMSLFKNPTSPDNSWVFCDLKPSSTSLLSDLKYLSFGFPLDYFIMFLSGIPDKQSQQHLEE